VVGLAGWVLDGDGDQTAGYLILRLVVFVVVFVPLGIGEAQHDRDRDIGLIGSVDPAAWYPVHEALASGVLPDDSHLDDALRRMVDDRRSGLGRARQWALGVGLVGTFGCVAGGVLGDDRWFVFAAALAIVTPLRWYRLEQRRQRLDALDLALRERPTSSRSAGP
jgi:hypothetical protein